MAVCGFIICHFFLFVACRSHYANNFELRQSFIELRGSVAPFGNPNEEELLGGPSTTRGNGLSVYETSYETFRQSSLTLILYSLMYFLLVWVILMFWFLISSLSCGTDGAKCLPGHYVAVYLSLLILFMAGKYMQKRIARIMDRIRIITTISIELMTEIGENIYFLGVPFPATHALEYIPRIPPRNQRPMKRSQDMS